MKIVSTLFCCMATFLISSTAHAARSADYVSEQRAFSESCSKEIRGLLSISSGEKLFLPHPLAMKRNLQQVEDNVLHVTTEGRVSIGDAWWDMSGAMPRYKGPRYQFASNRVESLAAFPKGWNRVFRAVKEHPETTTGKWGSWTVPFKLTVCSEPNDVVIISVIKAPGFRNKYGSEPPKFFILFQSGDMLPEFKFSTPVR